MGDGVGVQPDLAADAERFALAALIAHPEMANPRWLGSAACDLCVHGLAAADAALAAGFSRRDPASAAAALIRQNKHVRDLQAVIGHMGKVLDALRAQAAEPTPLDLLNHPHRPTLPDAVADARAQINHSLDVLTDLRAQLEGLEFRS